MYMETGLMIALGITLIVGVMLIFFNSTPSEAVKYKKTLEYVRFDAEEIQTEDVIKKRLQLVALNTYWEALRPFVLPEIVMKIDVCEEDAIPLGSSKTGGFPHICPQINIEPQLMFVAQINCEEIYPFDKENLLPGVGMLYFFLYPSKLKDNAKDAVSVIYSPHSDSLTPRKEVLTLPADVQSGRLRFFQGISLPPHDSEIVRNLLKDYETDGYFKVTNREQCHKTGGYPDTVTQDFRQEKDKVLLLQLDSDPQSGLLWGNMGRLFVFAEKQCVASRKFDQTYTFIQSYEEA
ncbi:MAG: DUF1963 domain-containing protein, partial [Bacteroidales bacterium]|nr:DUF1963 domain-containing protein [Bacteroidales bacterium]